MQKRINIVIDRIITYMEKGFMNSSFIKAGMTALGILTFWLTPLLTGAVAGASELNIYSGRLGTSTVRL